MERGPRYNEYANLRESKLRSKSKSITTTNPPEENKLKKYPASKRKGSSGLTQSVPDFSSVLRKENRKPPSLPRVAEKCATPPAKSSSRLYDVNAKLMGSKSSVSSKKRNGGLLAERRSYVNMDELKKFSKAAANAINGENRRGRATTVLVSRRFY